MTLRELNRLDAEASHLRFIQRFFEAKEGAPFIVSPHHRVMAGALDRVLSGEIKRLLINIPPGYTKTEMAVVHFIARGLAINPRAKFIHASFNGQLALENSSKVRDILRLPAYQDHWPRQIRDDTDAKGLWRTTEGGGLMAAAAGGPITGFRAGLIEDGFSGALIIDDPLKPDDAYSDIERSKINNRWHSTFKSRLAIQSETPVIVIMQRLHVDDFSGFLLRGGSGERWHHLLLPVIIDNGRAYPPEFTHGIRLEHGLPDGPLWPKKHDLAQIEVLRGEDYSFAGQYLQEPFLRDGGMFKRHWFPILPAAPCGGCSVRKWDLAATAPTGMNDPDWTVGVRMSDSGSNGYVIEDIVRLRASAADVERAILSTASSDGVGTTIHLNQDPGQAGKAQVAALTRMLSGYVVKSEPESGSKEVRAMPFAAQAEVGNVKLVAGTWNGPFLDELEAFPGGRHDDQVDAAAGAFNALQSVGVFSSQELRF